MTTTVTPTETEPRTEGIGREYADTIAKLLAKAEASDHAEEADALFAKATQLMMKYQIDEAMIAAARGLQTKVEEIIEIQLPFTGIYQIATMRIAFETMPHNNCKGFYSKKEYVSPKRIDVTCIGFESDVRNVEMLVTSLNVQCATAMAAWWRTEGKAAYNYNGGVAYRSKREFILGFATGVGTKMSMARRVAVADATASEAERTGSSASRASESVSLVLRSRKDSVNDWYDEKHARNLRTVTSHRQTGGMGARVAGNQAGQNANVGGTSIGGTKSIGN